MQSTFKNVNFFEHLSPDVTCYLKSRAQVRDYDRGTVLSLEGEPTRTLKIVLDGWVKHYRVTRDGCEAILATLHEGQSYDELAALHGSPSPVSAEAVTDCSVMLVDLNTVCSCTATNREIHTAILSAASGHMNAMLTQLQQLKSFTGIQRLAGFLLGLCHRDHGPADLELPYDKYLLAGQLGMKPESLSRAFSRLKDFGVTTQARDVRIMDVGALARVIDPGRDDYSMAA